MSACPDSRLYLFARLPDAVSEHLDVSNDIAPVLPGLDLVSIARRHITLAQLDVAGVPEDFIVALVGWIMATMPPFAFRVVFDQLVTSARSTLLKASRPLLGARGCQDYVVETARHYGLDLARQAAPSPHVTLGYSYGGPRGVRPIDGISWLVDELVLVRSWHGRTLHEELGRWTLPPRQRDSA
ncbi:2'-5' RNA ligase family protein [Sphingomonas abietis]|uniref:2'-5' RNA ligase n=1 Tax=Sphingomonas abietis TaxID=3012344 RepID=A0ABY7NLQ9_9SPHN|nr:hypothetical protein [Sphingomonas abietis]WBO22464.1 hypothetical protein PBT88_20415 [Sphingomonas abietis]